MKNSCLHIALAFAISMLFNLEANAQRAKVNGPAFVQVGIGLGGYNSASATSQTPYLIGTFQKTIIENLGPGNLSTGGTLTYKSVSYESFNSDWGLTYFSITGRANWHPHFIKVNKLDTYGGLALGYESAWVNARSEAFDGVSTGVNDLALSFHMGARYQITDKIGAWMELGAGQGVLNFGASYAL